jgi:hypothetical protein
VASQRMCLLGADVALSARVLGCCYGMANTPHTYTLQPAAHSHPSILAKAKKHRCNMMAGNAAVSWRVLLMWSAISWVCRVGGSSVSGLNVDVAVFTLCASEPKSPPRDCALSPSRGRSHLLACPAANAANICTLLRQATRPQAAGYDPEPVLDGSTCFSSRLCFGP